MSGGPYDPNLRRNTPLARRLKERIRREGPISVDRYIGACLYGTGDPGGHNDYYYATRPVIGRSGDFITAPEISQVFGELIGLWCIIVWEQMGRPAPFNLVEFGPGRGTLMRDALRAMRVRPEMLSVVRVVMLDVSVPLADMQRAALAGVTVPIEMPGKLYRAEAPKRPAIFIANEYLDTEPIEQFIRAEGGWVIRGVGLDGTGELTFVQLRQIHPQTIRELDEMFPHARLGDIAELYSMNHDTRHALSEPEVMTALLIDYGHAKSAIGDTLQAVRDHAWEHPLTSPGEADITAQFDFAKFTQEEVGHRAVDGPVTQAEFLGSLGIMERASRLIAANPSRANAIETGVARLMAPNGMGCRFQAIGIRSKGLPPLPGFPVRPSAL